jgi:tetratricopeptide (TPR) repeat protein
MDREEEAICTRMRVEDYVLATDSEELRQAAVRALSENGYAQVLGDDYEGAVDSWERMTGYVSVSDSVELREVATTAVLAKGAIGLFHGEQGGLAAAHRFARAHICHDDPLESRRSTAKAMCMEGYLLLSIDRYDAAESSFGMATEFDPDLDESWAGRADALLFQGDDVRLSEAEKYACRAVELGPDNPSALLTVSDILARRDRWGEALDQLERSVRIGGKELLDKESRRLTELLIGASVAGQRRRVREMMAESTLAERMEPLWHAVRVELGEELEPLPTEVMDAVIEVRRRISGNDGASARRSGACRRGPLRSPWGERVPAQRFVDGRLAGG